MSTYGKSHYNIVQISLQLVKINEKKKKEASRTVVKNIDSAGRKKPGFKFSLTFTSPATLCLSLLIYKMGQ